MIDKQFSSKDKKKPDFYKVRKIGEEFARSGNRVIMSIPIHYKDWKYKKVYGTLIGTKYERKCPDLMINGKPYEFEGYVKPWNKKKVGRMIHHGLLQAPNIIIDNSKGCSHRYIKRLIFHRNDAKELWVYEKGDNIFLYKKQKAIK